MFIPGTKISQPQNLVNPPSLHTSFMYRSGPQLFEIGFPGLPSIETETPSISDTTVMNRDNNSTSPSISIIYLFTRIDTRSF